MLYLLENLLRYGTSICIAGKTFSGKTNTAGYLLSTLPPEKRIVSIEEIVREVDLTKTASGFPRNVVQLATKDSDDGQVRVTLADLFRATLRLNPDYIFVGEMRSEEAWNAQEAARTDHAVITTIHAKSAASAYTRMVTLAKQAYDFSDGFLLGIMTEAFPIAVYQRRLENGRRVIAGITECLGCRGGAPILNELWRFAVDRNDTAADGAPIVEGHFEKLNDISQKLRSELLGNGMPDLTLERILNGGDGR